VGTARLRGLIVDLRGNGGATLPRCPGCSAPSSRARPTPTAATCTATALPPTPAQMSRCCTCRWVVLTDRNCASACGAFSGAVKDLRLGTLVGTRTAGIVAAPAAPYLLDDASLIILPVRHELSARHELINGIGVARLLPPAHRARPVHRARPRHRQGAGPARRPV